MYCKIKQYKMETTKQIILKQTANGKVFKCETCNLIHIEFKNLNFNFSEFQFEHFSDYIQKLNGLEWEGINENSLYNRKIIVPIGHKNFNFMLNNNELIELQELLNNQPEFNNLQTFQFSQYSFSTYLN